VFGEREMFYRKELDGIRALAVLAVIFYHAELSLYGVELFPGGFFGVDIFFVLSGFLITSIIMAKPESFSLSKFYIGRLNRIYPMLLLILVLSSCYAFLVVMPNELVSFAGSMGSALGFFSNFFFLNEDSYISDLSKLKPLIHTWSLGVEWQFYIAYPIILALVLKFFRGREFLSVLIVFSVSLAFCLFMVDRDLEQSFYLPYTRAWEMLAGALVCLAGRHAICKNRRLTDVMILVALVLIVVPMIVFNDHEKHPGIITLMPVMGCCLFIYFSSEKNPLIKVFSSRPIVFIGLISYSLYLWHQPLLAFYRQGYSEIDFYSFFLILGVTFILSYLSFKYVEGPFRRNTSRWKYATMGGAAAGLVAFCVFIMVTHGYPDRLSPIARDAYTNYSVPEFRRLVGDAPGKTIRGVDVVTCIQRDPSSACRFGDQSWVSVGDSFAGVFEYELKERLVRSGKGLVAMSYEQCPLLPDSIWFGSSPECTLINEARWKEISSMEGEKTFVIGGSFTPFYKAKQGVSDPLAKIPEAAEPVGKEVVYSSFASGIEKLIGLGHKVILIYPPPPIMTNVKNEVYKAATSRRPMPEKIYEDVNASLIKQVEFDLDSYVKDSPNLLRVRTRDLLCEGARCLVIDKDGGLYNVTSHLSNSGVKRVIDSFLM
jgi:peptidoglycan/LPS O-acetylase OafA/YrhL